MDGGLQLDVPSGPQRSARDQQQLEQSSSSSDMYIRIACWSWIAVAPSMRPEGQRGTIAEWVMRWAGSKSDGQGRYDGAHEHGPRSSAFLGHLNMQLAHGGARSQGAPGAGGGADGLAACLHGPAVQRMHGNSAHMQGTIGHGYYTDTIARQRQAGVVDRAPIVVACTPLRAWPILTWTEPASWNAATARIRPVVLSNVGSPRKSALGAWWKGSRSEMKPTLLPGPHQGESAPRPPAARPGSFS